MTYESPYQKVETEELIAQLNKSEAENKELRKVLAQAAPVLRKHYMIDCHDDDLLTATCDAMIAADKALAKYKEEGK